MKKIVLHGPAADNAGNFCDAGVTLEIGDKAAAGFITADRAHDLVVRQGAVSATAEERLEKAATPDFDPAPFTVDVRPGGRYSISGPGLDTPEAIRGKARVQARVAELRAAMPPAAADEEQPAG